MTPNGWRTITFGDAASLAYGKSLPAAQRKNGVVPVCGANGIIGFHDEPLARGPGIIVGRKGSVGAVTWVDKDFWPIDTTYYVKSKEPSDARWLYYAVSNLGLDKLNEATGIPGLNRSTAAAVTFYVPPLPEQRKIAAILSSLDDAIEKTQAVIDQVQVVKRGLMQELLTRGLPGRHTRFKQTEIGEIPEEWRTVSLAECGAGVTSGSRGWAKYYSDDGALFLRITNLARGSIRLQLGDTKHVTLPQRSAEAIRTRVQPRDLVISITADLGMVGVIPEDIGEAYVNQHVALVRFCSHEMRSEFAGYFLTTDVARNRFQRLNDSGAKAGLNLATIKNMTVPQPPCAEQDLIVKILSTMEDRLAGEVRTLDGLAAAKSALMSVLLTGELRVTPDPEVA